MESDDKVLLSSTFGNPKNASTPKPNKRCASESMMRLESASNVSVAKKRLILECDTTLLATPRTCLSTSTVSTLSTPGRMVSTARMNITRGIQTMRPETVNRYCQVSVARIQKPTATIHVQTEAPPAIVLHEIGCQTDEPLLPQTCDGITQTESFTPSHPVSRCEVSCQTDRVQEEQHRAEQGQLEEPEVEESDKNGYAVDSIATMLNDFAKQYGIDLQSPAKQKKAKCNSKKKEIEHLQECLANKTYKAMASKVSEKMDKILEKHMAEYGRQTVASRERLIRWTKGFLQRQQQQNRAATTVPSRKIVLVRKVVRAPKRPSVEEKSVQCASELGTGRITVGTQWQRQKPMVTKKQPVSSHSKASRSKAISTKPTSTDSKTCSAGSRHSMRQTKLSSYAKQEDGGKTIQGRQPRQRKQQGECSPKPSKSAARTVKPTPSSSKTTKAAAPSPPAAKKKTRNEKQAPKVTTDIFIEETPSPPASPPPPPPARADPELERKHFPYRSPPTYPTQCSKATDTSFLSPSSVRNLLPELMDNDPQPLDYRLAANNSRSFNPAVLLSPLERMYVKPTATAPSNRPEYNTFLVPLRTNEKMPPIPQRIMYLNPPERRVLLRTGPSNAVSVREKPPEISIISSQQLYSQIGLAVEKALKNQSLPKLADMYGEPFIEEFNGCGQDPQRAANDDRRLEAERNNEQATKQRQARDADKFVCSSGKEDKNFQGSQQQFVRPPFHTERSPSLSPIVYDDENSGDEMIL